MAAWLPVPRSAVCASPAHLSPGGPSGALLCPMYALRRCLLYVPSLYVFSVRVCPVTIYACMHLLMIRVVRMSLCIRL